MIRSSCSTSNTQLLGRVNCLTGSFRRFFLRCALPVIGLFPYGTLNADCLAREFSAAESDVLSAYIAFYGRPADPGGLTYWADRLQTEGSLSSIIQAFGNSPEFESRFGTLSNTELVTNLYQQLLARAPEAAGLAFYVDSLNARSTTLQSISLDILLGAMNEDKQTIQNRLAVAAHYISQLESLNATQLEPEAEALADLVASVTAEVATANTACASVDALVADLLAPSSNQQTYDIGSPMLQSIYVSTTGNDSNSGSSPSTALRTLDAAWRTIPKEQTLTTGYEILLAPGTYADDTLPNYMESTLGSAMHPVIIRALNGPGTVTLQGDLNLYNTHYLYLMDLVVTPVPAGDAIHCEHCDHLLLRNLVVIGGTSQEAQEALKINQSRYVYIEDSDISGAWDNAIDMVSVQYGHVLRNKIHNAGDWCQYAKGGSAYLRIEGNEYYNCGTGGFTAGQGTGFQFMVSPWLHYEAYDIQAVNNLVHDVEGAAFGVNGGFNILIAYNTAYRIGARSHLLEVVAGLRSCDGQPGDEGREGCQQHLDAGGWGTTLVDDGTNMTLIPNRHVYILNNLLFNPSGVESQWQQFTITGLLNNPAESNVPGGSRGDEDLHIAGNLIWNGSADKALGIDGENSEAGCNDNHASCSTRQILADNAINTLEPQLIDPESGNFNPVPEGTVFDIQPVDLPVFSWSDLPAAPVVPPGSTRIQVEVTRSGAARAGQDRIGAW